jgi:hypothetical protein
MRIALHPIKVAQSDASREKPHERRRPPQPRSRSLLISDGDLSTFWTRPGAAILLALNVALILSQLPVVKRLFKRKQGSPA